ncbi:hypothetical protein [Streptomyces sp. ISL-100]|uniref:hypothetical protein n=1 Tax=Streptomyces sp. ISL-100 TaxID=2819173 RepID=UPI001BE8E619|nr:hypothetical protein [Streptomyces sp. ISL-100]MBT2397989.1 hypothetical protein [Streptomyces sp. ISL-100]
MRTRLFSTLSGLLLSIAAAVLAVAPGAQAATGLDAAADSLRQGPVYVDQRARDQLPPREADALEEKILDAGKPVFVAVLPQSAEFPEDGLLADLRTKTGITGVYAVRLGDAFDAGADSAVMSRQAVDNLTASVEPAGGLDAVTQLNTFVDDALDQARGGAPNTWDGASQGPSSVVGLVTFGLVLVAGAAGVFLVAKRNRGRRAAQERAALEKVRVVVDEDITAFGETLERLDFHPAEPGADDAMRADYERALDAYERAKSAMAKATKAGDARAVTQALEDGRFSLAVLAARREGKPLPERRPPCFFDPRHGPSTADVDWAPAGGTTRRVPVCAADATRLAEGQDPMSRMVETADGRRPYWEAGPAYAPWIGGYYGGGLLPGLLMGTMLGSMLSAPAYADSGMGGYEGGDFSGGDFNAGDFGGGGDVGGGFGGGGDFGGGGF